MSRLTLLAAVLLAAAVHTPAAAQEAVPRSLAGYRPHEIVEAVISEAPALGVSAVQLRRLDDLHVAVRDERHRWIEGPGNKAQRPLRMQPMITRQRAYADALAVLTLEQRGRLVRIFATAGYVPVVPSLAAVVPPSLESLRPHEIVAVFLAEQTRLGLRPSQVDRLQALLAAVRDEPHRYVRRSHGAKGPEHLMMEPMFGRRRAYNDALACLTPDQRVRAMRLFRSPDYRTPQGLAAR